MKDLEAVAINQKQPQGHCPNFSIYRSQTSHPIILTSNRQQGSLTSALNINKNLLYSNMPPKIIAKQQENSTKLPIIQKTLTCMLLDVRMSSALTFCETILK
jgi:hypothetical protein